MATHRTPRRIAQRLLPLLPPPCLGIWPETSRLYATSQPRRRRPGSCAASRVPAPVATHAAPL